MIRDVESLQIIQLYSNLDKVETLEWSPDSAYVLCGLYKRGIAQVGFWGFRAFYFRFLCPFPNKR